jgi:membrane associated rhomboid family serine protease
MLADRHYMRRERPEFVWSVTIVLLAVNVAIFFVEHLNGSRLRSAFLQYGALSLEGLRHGFVWQFLTFQFLHDGLPHLVLNSIALYFFGRPVEERLGKPHLLKLYLLSGVLGGVLQALLGLMSPQFSGPMVGASAGICGLVAAFSLLEPDQYVYIGLIIPLRARYLLPLMIALPLVFLLLAADSHVAHAAHLGGTLGGIAYLRWVVSGGFRWTWRPFGRTARPRELVKTASTRRAFWQREVSKTVEDLPPAEFISREVDPILDKISAHGIQSLTDRERRILEAARAKMSKR